MQTRCPSCRTVFHVTPAQLAAADGRVKCGQCAAVFNAAEHSTEDAGAKVSSGAGSRAAPAGPDEAVPEILQRRDPPRPSAWWGLGVLLLVVIALLQLGWFGRDYWIKLPNGRQLLEQVCTVAGCELPPQAAPGQVRVETRSVTSHPSLQGVLRVRMTFVNRADFPQPYPLLQVTFFRDDIEPAVQRTFRPAEYLEQPPAADAVLEVGQMVYVELDVEDPGADVTGFQFEFF